MRDFKFLIKPKREVLEILFSVEELNILKNYCVDFLDAYKNNTYSDLNKYYLKIGLVVKVFRNGALHGFNINFFRGEAKMDIYITLYGENGTDFIIERVIKYNAYDNISTAHFYPDEQL